MYLISLLTTTLFTTTLSSQLQNRDIDAFQNANLRIVTYNDQYCSDHQTSNITDVLCGIDYHASCASYTISHDLEIEEQLDWSQTGDPGSSGIDAECAVCMYTASPRPDAHTPLKAHHHCYLTNTTVGVSKVSCCGCCKYS